MVIKIIKNWRRNLVFLVLFNALFTMNASANDRYPDRSVRVIVGFQAGASTDTVARLISQQLSERLNQSFVVENKPGAATRIAMDVLRKSPGDGYVLAVATAVVTLFPVMFEETNFEPGKDFIPISMLGRSPSFLVVRSGLPIKNYQDFKDYAKTHKMSMAHPGNGTNPHLAGLALARSLGTSVVDVAYKGSQPIATALAAGEIDFALLEYEPVRPLLDRGEVRVLAVTEPKRFPLQPDVPTGRELGMPMEIESLTPWYALLAPAGTSTEIVSLLNGQVSSILKTPAIQDRLLKVGIDPMPGSSEDALKQFKAHRQRIMVLLEKLGVSLKN
mgnify:FL=1